MIGYSDLLAMATDETWAIKPQALTMALSEAKAGTIKRRAPRLPKVDGAVAILPIHGMITQRGSAWDELFGGTSTMAFEAAFARAMNSDRIAAIVLDTDSPGGVIHGVQLASQRVFDSRGQGKPVVSVVNSNAHSAAYWIASSAEAFVGVPGASAGSIGVYRMGQDVSGMMEQQGVKVDFYAVPEYKVEGNPFEPMSKEGREFQMEQVQISYDKFNGDVSRNRSVTPAHAAKNFGKGRSFHSEQAAEAGMIDRVASMPKVLGELGVGTGKATLTQAESQTLQDELCHAWETGVIDEPRKRTEANNPVTRRRMLEARESL